MKVNKWVKVIGIGLVVWCSLVANPKIGFGWGNDYIIANNTNHEKACVLGVTESLSYLYSAYELWNESSNPLKICCGSMEGKY
jgi:hypothetical protein